jgi:beta-lactamase class A
LKESFLKNSLNKIESQKLKILIGLHIFSLINIIFLFFYSVYNLPALANLDQAKVLELKTVDKQTLDIDYQKFNEIKMPELLWSEKYFKTKIEEILGSEKDRYGIYISTLDTKEKYTFEYNQEKVFAPASLSKLPVLILTFIDISNGEYSLDQRIPFKATDRAYEFDGLYSTPVGSGLVLEDVLFKTAANSDNTGMKMLENLLGGVEKVNQRTKDELGVKSIFRDPHERQGNRCRCNTRKTLCQ